MPQVLKPEVRDRIESSALEVLAQSGYGAASMAAIAARAGTATANLYRYFPDKRSLFDAVLPRDLVDRHEALLDERVDALTDAAPARASTAAALLDFWIAHRLQVTILLDRAAGTPFAGYPAHFVARLARRAEAHAGAPLDDHHRDLLRLVFDNTRRAIAQILYEQSDPKVIRTMIEGFWSYQLPGLDGLSAWIAATPASR